ncbi:MAG TPA: phosphoribosylanthranilate isomerase [Vicinamibacterales bacterium]
MSVRVKVCGITSVEDALMAAEFGASAIGLVFWPKSPRAIDRATASEIVRALPPLVEAIGVFVDQQDADAIASDVGLHAVQLHGDESVDTYRRYAHRVIKAVAVNGEKARDRVRLVPPGVDVLLDAHDAARRGGTGDTIDWPLASAIASERRIILSGGLNASNVADAIRTVMPAAIDVSSGVESSPGRKDRGKVRDFFTALAMSHEP